ncbi:metallophosphoesterase [Candidatus Bathyarchaeota archaeon]|nr:metallophosphoesterase [Candidatus Bathyarchaeota archaeon]
MGAPVDVNDFFDIIQDSVRLFGDYQKHHDVTGKLIALENDSAHLILGDIHGDYNSLSKVLGEADIGRERIICLGDYVDRGPDQIRVLHEVLTLALEHPEDVVLLRGNHEGPSDIPCFPSDFRRVVYAEYGSDGVELAKHLQRLYDSMYHAVFIESEALMLHGGIPTTAETLEDIAYAQDLHPAKPFLEEILWNDPADVPESRPSPRGAGKLFGQGVTESFLGRIGARSLVRGHESAPSGYKVDFGRVLTVFSCKIKAYSNSGGAYLRMPRGVHYSVENMVPRIRVI